MTHLRSTWQSRTTPHGLYNPLVIYLSLSHYFFSSPYPNSQLPTPFIIVFVKRTIIGPFLVGSHVDIVKRIMKADANNPLHLTSLNHISLVCGSLEESISFYQDVLGFVPICRPGSFDFDGAWLFGYGIGIHLLQSEDPAPIKKEEINPKDNHISFQCESMGAVEKKLEDMGLQYIRAVVKEGGIQVDQLFFHDPDGFMIEICNCDNLPVVPIAGEMVQSCSLINLHAMQASPTQNIKHAVHQ